MGTAAVSGVSAGQVEVVLTGTSLGVLAATNALLRILSRHKIRTSGGAVQAIRGGTPTAVARLQLDKATELVAELKQAGFLVAPLPVAAATARSAASDVMGQLRQLGELRDAGVLTSEEFETKKADLLARM